MAREAVFHLSDGWSDVAGGGGPLWALCGAARVDGQGTGEGLRVCRRCRQISEARLRRGRAEDARFRREHPEVFERRRAGAG